MFDMIIRQGLILDGTAAPGKVADLGIVGDQIAAIGDLSGESAKQVDRRQGESGNSGIHRPAFAFRFVCFVRAVDDQLSDAGRDDGGRR